MIGNSIIFDSNYYTIDHHHRNTTNVYLAVDKRHI